MIVRTWRDEAERVPSGSRGGQIRLARPPRILRKSFSPKSSPKGPHSIENRLNTEGKRMGSLRFMPFGLCTAPASPLASRRPPRFISAGPPTRRAEIPVQNPQVHRRPACQSRPHRPATQRRRQPPFSAWLCDPDLSSRKGARTPDERLPRAVLLGRVDRLVRPLLLPRRRPAELQTPHPSLEETPHGREPPSAPKRPPRRQDPSPSTQDSPRAPSTSIKREGTREQTWL